MKVSLNQLVQLLSDRVGQPFNVPLQEELKVIINYKRADWFQKVLAAHPGQRSLYLKDIGDELISIDRAECPIQTDCTVLRTSKKIPIPLRIDDKPFDYVGDPDKFDGYGYATPDQVYWLQKYNKYTGSRPKYFYINGYVYIYNEPDLGSLNIRAVWPDQRQLNPFKCNNVPCYTDDDQYDIPDDIINTMMQDVLKNEMRMFFPELAEVTVDEKKQ